MIAMRLRSSRVVILVLAGCSESDSPIAKRLITLDDLKIQATFGLDEGAGPRAVFHKPMGGRVSRRRGADPRCVRAVGPLVFSRPAAFRSAGASWGCGGLLALIDDPGGDAHEPIFAIVLVRVAPDGSARDTLARFTPVRPSSRNYHPWYVLPSEGRLLVYPELAERDVLLEMDCDGSLIREIAIDSLGPGERWVFEDGGVEISWPQPPRPGGMTRIGGRVLWATQTTETSVTGVDSVTRFTAFEPGGSGRQVRIHGWYQLYASDASGALLLGNTWTAGQNWTYGATWGLLPTVFLVSGTALLELIDAVGTEAPAG